MMRKLEITHYRDGNAREMCFTSNGERISNKGGFSSIAESEFRGEQELIHTICCSSLLESKMSLSDCLSEAENIGSLQSELIRHCFTLPDLLTVNMDNMTLLISV